MTHLPAIPSLKRVYLANNKLTGKGLNELQRQKSLEYLNVDGELALTLEDLKSFAEAMPGVKIVSGHGTIERRLAK